MTKTIFALLFSAACFGQVVIPEGTKLRVRLDQSISSATADEGQSVQLAVTEPVKAGDQVVISEGAIVTGTVTTAVAKRRMGRAGKLDFSIDRVRSVDGEWIPLRYTIRKKDGESHAVRTGVLTAGAAVVFWPAAPVFLLMHGKDVTINKGVTFDVFTDTNHIIQARPAGAAGAPLMQTTSFSQQAPAGAAPGSAGVSVTSSTAGAEIEVDGAFVGNTPATLQLPAGVHRLTVKNGAEFWERNISITAGSSVAVYAVTTPAQAPQTGAGALQRASKR
ncbi:MAG TPA: PEGA domain-containing protein [Bryobacteraceae bacterium]|nr:PEGA domain-containing protein [Bryobacteraceae bacterium]